MVVDIPKDIQTASIDFDTSSTLNINAYRERVQSIVNNRLSDEDCARFFDYLKTSSRPLIYSGGGTMLQMRAQELRKFSARLQFL
ncbi:MAG: hypothetical protein Ct9H300mP6_08890 [Gammaproteobacteria bacterium]|nr:MAG: hypothetical protein Ct9H300mP6_08890 [Gammaproteobacteria bacterium]